MQPCKLSLYCRLLDRGLDMEKMRLATEAEKERLSEYIKYEDGQVDQPFLSSDTVKGD